MKISGYKRCSIIIVAFLLQSMIFAQSNAQDTANVDLNLVLAIDSSYSVNSGEYNLQMAGMAAAFLNPEVVRAIKGGVYGAISVTVVQWSRPESQIIVVPWMRIASAREALALAALIAKTKRQTAEGATSISGMLKFGAELIRTSPYRGTRNIIDIVADGENNAGERVEQVRNRLVASGITINGLAILNEVSYLYYYMRNRVIGGSTSFVEQAADYTDFSRAIHRKLLREIKGVPVS